MNYLIHFLLAGDDEELRLDDDPDEHQEDHDRGDTGHELRAPARQPERAGDHDCERRGRDTRLAEDRDPTGSVDSVLALVGSRPPRT